MNVGDPVWSAGGWSFGERGVVTGLPTEGIAAVEWETRGPKTEWQWELLTSPPPEDAHVTELRRAKAAVRDAVTTRVAEMRATYGRGSVEAILLGRVLDVVAALDLEGL